MTCDYCTHKGGIWHPLGAWWCDVLMRRTAQGGRLPGCPRAGDHAGPCFDVTYPNMFEAYKRRDEECDRSTSR